MTMFVLILLLICIAGVIGVDDCPTINLYDEYKDKFGESSSTLKKIDGKYFKCLAMYDKNPPWNLHIDTVEKIINVDNGGLYVDRTINLIKETKNMAVLKKDFEDELCNRSDYIAALKDKVFPYFNLEYKRRVKPTCPFGLIWDMACTFAICFHSGNCMVDDILSCSNNIDPCQPQVHVQPFCKRSFNGFLTSCFEKDERLEDLLNFNRSPDENCASFNHINQGLTSLQEPEEKGIIAIDYKNDEEIEATCFEQRVPINSVSWRKDEEKVDTDSDKLNVKLAEVVKLSSVSCNKQTLRVAQIEANKLSFSSRDSATTAKVTDPSATAAEVTDPSAATAEVTDPPAATAKVTDPPATAAEVTDPSAATSQTFTPLSTTTDFRKEALLLENSYGSLEGMDAFNNRERLLRNVDKLSVAVVSVMGRLTPICGEFWNKRAAEVFCRDAGTQVQQNWTAIYVGAVHTSTNKRHDQGNRFYVHHLRNITCKGDESKLIWCDHDGWFPPKYCSHDAVVICSEVKKELPERGLNKRHTLVIVLTSCCVLVVLTAVSLVIFRFRYPEQYRSVQKKILGRAEKRSNDHELSKQSDYSLIPIPSTTTKTLSSTTSKTSSSTDPVSNDSGYSEALSSFSGWGSSSVIIDNREDLDSPSISVASVIEELELRQLNSKAAPHWVLFCKTEDRNLICKSFENHAGESVEEMKTEQFFLSNCDHPNIVKCVEQPREVTFQGEKKLSFFMEYLEHEGLDVHLRKKDQNGINNGHLMTVEDATNIIIGACRALHYVHSLGYVHADICSDNFFVFREPETGLLNVKLGDFESFYRPASDNSRTPLRFTPLYAAPEFVLNKPTKDAFKNDVWGLAWVIWEVQSWVMCRNNLRGQQEPVQSRSLNMFSKSILMVSRIVFTDDYTCRRHVHVALLKKLNRTAPKAADRPDLKLLEEFYQRIYPNGIGYPEMSPHLDEKFGWSLTSLLKKCLDISPAHRFSAREIVEFLLKESKKESSLSKYKFDLESDL